MKRSGAEPPSDKRQRLDPLAAQALLVCCQQLDSNAMLMLNRAFRAVAKPRLAFSYLSEQTLESCLELGLDRRDVVPIAFLGKDRDFYIWCCLRYPTCSAIDRACRLGAAALPSYEHRSDLSKAAWEALVKNDRLDWILPDAHTHPPIQAARAAVKFDKPAVLKAIGEFDFNNASPRIFKYERWHLFSLFPPDRLFLGSFSRALLNLELSTDTLNQLPLAHWAALYPMEISRLIGDCPATVNLICTRLRDDHRIALQVCLGQLDKIKLLPLDQLTPSHTMLALLCGEAEILNYLNSVHAVKCDEFHALFRYCSVAGLEWLIARAQPLNVWGDEFVIASIVAGRLDLLIPLLDLVSWSETDSSRGVLLAAIESGQVEAVQTLLDWIPCPREVKALRKAARLPSCAVLELLCQRGFQREVDDSVWTAAINNPSRSCLDYCVAHLVSKPTISLELLYKEDKAWLWELARAEQWRLTLGQVRLDQAMKSRLLEQRDQLVLDSICIDLAQQGDLEGIKWAQRVLGCPWDKRVLSKALYSQDIQLQRYWTRSEWQLEVYCKEIIADRIVICINQLEWSVPAALLQAQHANTHFDFSATDFRIEAGVLMIPFQSSQRSRVVFLIGQLLLHLHFVDSHLIPVPRGWPTMDELANL